MQIAQTIIAIVIIQLGTRNGLMPFMILFLDIYLIY